MLENKRLTKCKQNLGVYIHVYKSLSLHIRTNDCIQGEGTLSEDLFVAGHCRTFLTSFPVQVS